VTTGDSGANTAWTVGTITLVGMWLGLLGGLGEVGVQAIRRFALDRFVSIGRDFVWLIPLMTMLVSGSIALVLGWAGYIVRVFRRPVVVLGMLGWLAAFSTLRFMPKVSDWALALVAAGIVAQAVRGVMRGLPGFVRLVRISTPVTILVLMISGLLLQVWWGLQERREVRNLPPAMADAQNVLLLVLDTVRAWEMSVYGFQRPTTPNLQRRAERGIVFERAYAESPWTLPSHAAMFTGRSPTALSTGWFTPLDRRYRTVAEAMRAGGYLTGGFVANFHYAEHRTGLSRGFIRYQDHPLSLEEVLGAPRLLRAALMKIRGSLGDPDYWGRKSAEEVNNEFLNWVDTQPRRPFFAFLNYYDAHTPYDPPAPWRERFTTEQTEPIRAGPNRLVEQYSGTGLPDSVVHQLRDRYDGTIAYLDAQIETLLIALEDRGLLKRTVVVITSDHGELLGEYELLDHGNSLYAPLLHVPLVVLDPAIPSGLRVSTPVSIRNLAATIPTLGGLVADQIPGEGLSRLWRGQTGADSSQGVVIPVSLDSDPRLWWSRTPINLGDMRGIIGDSMLYIANGDGSEELYRVTDQGTAPDLLHSPGHQDVLATLRGKCLAVFGRHRTKPVCG